MAKLAITLKKSTIGFPRNQRRTVASLGLRRLHQTVEHDDTPVTLGMVRKVQHLLDVQEVAES
jgi:large subunit ribosomal protein L30